MAGLLAAGCTSGSASTTVSLGTTSSADGSTVAPTTALASVYPLEAPPVDLPAEAFGLGVASGAPTAESVILWTRFLGELPANVPLVWEVSTDPEFAVLVATGETEATDRFGHSVHVDVAGLQSYTTYWYRFRSDSQTSSHGRTKTLDRSWVLLVPVV